MIKLFTLCLVSLVATPIIMGQGATTFSSRYSFLTNCGSGLTRKEEREAEKHGTDIPTKCRGLDGYAVNFSYSACSTGISLDRGDESISLGMQSADWKQKKLEWRMANGNPFAVILRVYDYAGSDIGSTDGKITGETLIVKGLKVYEHIDETVNAIGNANANLKARELADAGFHRQ